MEKTSVYKTIANEKRPWQKFVTLNRKKKSADQEKRNCLSLLGCIILVPLGCHNKVSQTGWPKRTEIDCLTVMDARGLKPMCGQGHATSEICEGNLLCLLLVSGSLPAIFDTSWFAIAKFQSLALSLQRVLPMYVYFHMAISNKNISHIGLGANPILHYDLIITNCTCHNPISK